MRHNGHIRQRGKDSFELRYSLGLHPVSGKWRVKSVTVKGTRKDAEKQLRQILNSLDMQEYVEATKMTLREYFKQWLGSVRGQITLKTYESYEETVDKYLIPAFGNIAINKLTPLHIQNAYNDWQAGGRRDKKVGGLSPRTRLYIHRILKSALKHAMQLQLISRNPADFMKAPRLKKTTVTTLTIEESDILLNAIRPTTLYWPVLLAITTGMRRGEILALRWKNVDLERKTIRVVESLEDTKQGLRFKSPKTGRTRAVILPEYVVQELRALKIQQAEEFKEIGISQTNESTVCSRYDNRPMLPLTITHQFGIAIRRLPQLPRVRFHDLRHSHATQLLT
jgi:hypothetical protein